MKINLCGILNLKCSVSHRASLSKVENRAVVAVKISEIQKIPFHLKPKEKSKKEKENSQK